MKITQEVREFAKLQNQGSESFIAAEDAEKGMAQMSEVYDATGRSCIWVLVIGSMIEA
jgi:phosphomethylpyrimidine synthase